MQHWGSSTEEVEINLVRGLNRVLVAYANEAVAVAVAYMHEEEVVCVK